MTTAPLSPAVPTALGHPEGPGAAPPASDPLTTRLINAVRPEKGEIPAFIHVDPEVYARELQRVFGRCWLFVAHESEVSRPGDFLAREMGIQPVIVSRGADGVVRVLLNICRHRGMRLACEDKGNSETLRCSYHGWSYGSDGKFLGAPYQRYAYAEGLDRPSLGLLQARTETYRGLIFATWDPNAAPLEDYLGDMAFYLDIMVGRAEMEVVGVAQRWHVPSAWKLPAENFASDAYHTATTHAFLSKLGLAQGVDFGRLGYHVEAGGGHGLGIGVQDDGPWYPEELRAEYEEHLTPQQLALTDRIKNFHGNVFPNFSFLIPNLIEVDGHTVSGTTLRQWQPLGPDSIQVWSWYLVEKNAPSWWKELGRKTYIQTFGSSGMFEQDDTENWEHQTRAALASLSRDDEVMYHYQMALGRPAMADPPGPGTVYDGKYNEAAARGFYRAWLNMMVSEK